MEAQLVELGSRLRTVAALVPVGARLADVGTDHAQLLAWLRARGRIERGIGVDIAEGPLRQAEATLRAAGIDDVQLRRGDGLTPLRPGEVDTVSIAGMGGARMMRLVDTASAVVSGLSRLVLQPNTEWTNVRRWIGERGFALDDERMVEDRGKFYVVLAVNPQASATETWSEDELLLGPRLMRQRPAVFLDWLRAERARLDRALARADDGSDRDDPKLSSLAERRTRLTRALES
ncbi:MAG: class I SAM-dependent methyltransferase [Myxococcota bacterium]